ncbi:Mus7/MMS22 family-domain-containing protein [Annulohypoxylon maeteangense]|uniref:Mus7/MMS22 family-domain-containing protein n=1 Tax=Annulohypoxylon maeteangense TaxID=1927788 RepID=UPI0020077DCF|nr:Mus7/MMS22 family-domain-containing protein [Annulohypoxylon maeteangense]KAI0884885.1 Mus7/MMS22 family-domain-containing protein [Annulohypoxylon maeteangense]
MATWKELGEVPDSDDESGFDSSSESECELPQQPSSPGDNPGIENALEVGGIETKKRTVWDIPLSSQNSGKECDAVEYPNSLPLQAPLEPESIQQLDSSPLSSPLPEPLDDFDNSIKPAETEKAELDTPQAPEAPPAKQYTTAVFEVEDTFEDEVDFAQEGTRLGRSLRPRKPIQEHPYLLESAQYSKTLKSHGVRPLRVQIEEAARKRQEEEDSQEQDYEDDSQSTARGFVQEDSGESQEIQPAALFEDTEGEAGPASSPPPPERREEAPVPLLGSSQGDDEFPDPADVAKWNLGKRPIGSVKRQASPRVSKKRKLPKLHQPARLTREASPSPYSSHIFDIPPSPPQTSPNFLTATPITAIRRSVPVTTLTPKRSSTVSSQNQSPAPANQNTSMIDLTAMADTSSEHNSGSSSDSESESETVQATMRRRMRGVLPASWLRLDQQGTRQKSTQAIPQRSPGRSPERTQRKGVAQRRQISPKPSNRAALFLDESDDEDVTLRADEIDEPRINNQTDFSIFEDDAASVIEDDPIDFMMPGRKRTNTHLNGSERPRKRKKNQQSTFKGQPGQAKRQQRITGLLGRTKGSSAGKSVQRHLTSSSSKIHRMRDLGRAPARSTPPPRLGILDVVEPGAPSFIRIAARTANRRQDKGRSSPSKKQIALGTRQDNVDAISALRDWKKGRIQPRTSSGALEKLQENPPKSLRPLSNNSVVQAPKTSSKPRHRQVVPSSHFSQPQRMVKQASIDNFVTVEAITPYPSTYLHSTVSVPKRSQIARAKTYSNATSRPAQLETAGERAGRHAFDQRKRVLDALYRKSRRNLPTLASGGLDRLVGGSVLIENPNQCAEDLASNHDPKRTGPSLIRKRLKPRKHFLPQHVDITAPQYAHANDPLPHEVSLLSPIVEETHTTDSTGKLLGLGPFGTHYTQHFEIFPLDFGVFFHESTLLGSGRLLKASYERSPDSLHRSRGYATFTLDEKALRWGQWDAQTSSELGIIFDWMVDYLHSDSLDLNRDRSLVLAADFVLDYLQDYVTFSDGESEKHFSSRVLEILHTFTQRLDNLKPQSSDRIRSHIEILSRSLIIIFQVLRICHSLNQLSEIFQLEELLSKIAKRTVRQLLETELVDVRNLYRDLQRMPFRERGIHNDNYSAVCWVILIRVLEETHIPRSGFWDVVSFVMLSRSLTSISDAHAFERIWFDLFTLLPLGEFDNTGVVVPGSRHTTPLEGWSLPQALLRRIFQLYEGNSRQSPSFNDYCRGIVSRCHYLVEQWGWRKSNGIIGTIFDFFAARGLSHLRNEEVYKSPDFLECLTGHPPLAIVPEDRCFHIFLKLLALSIRNLESRGFTKDVRNMVARVLPNHNRQYEKEKDIHESDLAALRNHHDLLCTLFWAAPASLRPSVQTIEKLVVPASSHKEACLISLRAWSQLSRFVMSSDESTDAYKPFADWQKSIFQQVIEQYLSAESDIQQQLSRMSKDASKNISRDMMNAVVKLNRKSAMDVIHFSMKGFLGVIKHAPTLSAASFALNHYQLDQVFTRFPFSSEDFDWSSLRVALDIIDHYTTRIEEFLINGPETADHSWHGEDAIMLLEHKMAVPFFSMTRTIIGMDFRDSGLGPTSDRSICMEQAVLLAGRLAARLVHARLLRVSQFFATGRHSIFHTMSKVINSPSRRYHALFLTTLIQQGIDDFKDLGVTILDLFLVELVKPMSFLAYENRLALTIKRHGDPYLKNAVVEIGNNPDYNSNRELFSRVVAMMRKTLRFTEVNQKQQLQSQFSKALKSTMDQMKADLKSITFDSPEHVDYIEFVRSIVTVIRSQDLCPVDSYFYQISREYSPSSQDPRLQIAGILSWGLKLEEGDTKATPGLFYLLFHNFKLALANGNLEDESVILQQGMGNPGVFYFMLSTMFPAIIKTALSAPEGWIILIAYVNAFEKLLTAPCMHRAIVGEDMNGLLAILASSLASIHHLQSLDAFELHAEYVLALIQVMRFLNLVSPSFTAYLINNPDSQVAAEITEATSAFTAFTRAAGEYLSALLNGSEQANIVHTNGFFRGMCELAPNSLLQPNEHVNRFANHMVRDICDNWVSDDSVINIRGPSRVREPGKGTPNPKRDAKKLIQTLHGQLQEWNYTNDVATTKASRRIALPLEEYLF